MIGAGYTGLAAARHLTRTGASVLVLERDRVGAGASSRNGGQVLTGLKLAPATGEFVIASATPASKYDQPWRLMSPSDWLAAE